MIKHLVSLTFICLLFACRSQEDKNNYASLIKGDWVGREQSREPWESQTTIFASFEDSTYQNGLLQDSFKYEIQKDTLYLKGVDWEGYNFLNKFSIVKLTSDSLVLLSGYKQEYTSRFSKVRAKNTIIPDTIRFASSAPNMYVEIDSSRNFRFHKGWYASMKGGFRGKIGEGQYNSIVNKIRNLPADSLQNFYDQGGDDVTAMGVFIIHGNKTTHAAAYGHDREPMELYLLFAKLINVYKHVNMQPDSTLNDEYFFWNYNIMHELMPMSDRFLPPKIVPRKR